MANESVAHIQPVKQAGRSRHGTDLIDAVNERIAKARAIIDLLVTVDSQQLFKDTISNAGWSLLDLLDEVNALVAEEEEAAA